MKNNLITTLVQYSIKKRQTQNIINILSDDYIYDINQITKIIKNQIIKDNNCKIEKFQLINLSREYIGNLTIDNQNNINFYTKVKIDCEYSYGNCSTSGIFYYLTNVIQPSYQDVIYRIINNERITIKYLKEYKIVDYKEYIVL